MTEQITLTEAQEKVDQWIKTLGVRYFNELTNLAMLTEEVGELARIIARSSGMPTGVTPSLVRRLIEP